MSFEYILFGKMGVIMSYKSLKKSNLRQIIGQIIDILLIFENIFIILNNI